MPTAQLSLLEQFQAEDPSQSDEEAVVSICAEMLHEAEAIAPVDVELIASVCGIDEVRYGGQLWAGMLFQEQGKLVAQVRAGDGHERQRFTVLHEGGHTFLPGFLRARRHRCKGPRTHEERLCDLAAAEMLFPRREFATDLGAVGLGLDSVESLARQYQASIESTGVRIVTLTQESVMLLNLRYAHKPRERGQEHCLPPKLRLQWSMSNGPWPFPLRNKSVEARSPIARAWEWEIVDEVAEINELFASPIGPVRVQARRYGDRVLAMLRPLPRRS